MRLSRNRYLTGKMRSAWTAVVLLVLMVWQMPVLAAGISEITGNMVLKTGMQAELYEEASDQSQLVATLEAETIVFTVEASRDGWCKISVGEYTGYVRTDALTTIGEPELIRQELEQNISHNFADDTETQHGAASTGMWGRIVLLLVVVVLAVGGIYRKLQ